MKVVSTIREKGLRWCIAIIFDRYVPQWLLRVRRFNVYEMDPESVAAIQSGQASVRWSESEEETQRVEQFMGPQRSVVDVGAESMRACYATLDGEIAGAFWAADTVFMESGLSIRYSLNEDQVWLFGAYVAKPFRRHGVYTSILKFILPELATSGKKSIFLAVNPDNVASRKVHEKHARRKLGTAVAVRFLNFALCTAGGSLSINRSFTWNHKTHPIVIRFDKTQ